MKDDANEIIDTDNWNVEDMVEITFEQEDDFLKIKETLTRIGIPSFKENILYQSCNILHKKGKYYIVHFKELFALDGKNTSFTKGDARRRNTILKLLVEWGLCDVVDVAAVADGFEEVNKIKIIKHGERDKWNLKQKYNIGTK